MDKHIKIGGRAWDLRASKFYEKQLDIPYDDPKLEENLVQWCDKYSYWNTELLIGGVEYSWPKEGETRVLKPKYVLKHILHCIDLHKAFYEAS